MTEAATAENPSTQLRIARVANLVRATDSNAFLVESRVVRRVICEVHDLAQFLYRVPHASAFVISANRIRGIVHNDELGLDHNARLPERVILISLPSEKKLERMSDEELLLRTWRLLFHARIDFAYTDLYESGRLTESVVRERIDQIGQVEFDEIQSTLERENLLIVPDNRSVCYREFGAIFFELQYFAPDWLETWFPSLTDTDWFARIIGRDIRAAEIFRQTKLPGAPDPIRAQQEIIDDSAEDEISDGLANIELRPSPWRYRRYMRKADKATAKGNSIRAAECALSAAERGDDEQSAIASKRVAEELKSFVARLQSALNFDDEEAKDWHRAIVGLIRHSTRGAWNADKKLLYDLQKVCIDHERDSYSVDLVKWIVSLGKTPIKRALPNQREVMMSKHLRSAAARLVSVRLSGYDRERMAVLLRHAADSAEHQMRTRLRPLVDESLQQVGLVPGSLPERVAYKKLIEECLDSVAERGFLTMGYLRDGISRNNLKLADLQNVSEILLGDRLLRADDQFARALDGVYHRGEFYLRWLQVISSMFFGTRPGRFATQYIFIPFGGAFVALEGMNHLIHVIQGKGGHAKQRVLDAAQEGSVAATEIADAIGAFAGNAAVAAAETASVVLPVANETSAAVPEAAFSIVRPETVIALGFVIMGLMHWEKFRHAVAELFKALGRVLRLVFITAPQQFYNWPPVRAFLRSPIVRAIRHYIISPALLTAILFLLIPRALGIQLNNSTVGIIFVLLSFLLNSRLGRDAQELAAEWITTHYHQLHAAVFVSLLDLIYEFFKWLLNQIERVFYAVDEWLRFRSGETFITLVLKSVLGVIWSFVHFILRFCVNLLIEPQINPIKHFPVVTVSHKLLLPTMPVVLGPILTPLLGSETAATSMAVTIATLIPGIFGFLVWELKENWRLYHSNRPQHLKAAIIGSHGETLLKLMKPGFHSGTQPKLFRKLRRLERRKNSFRRYHIRKGLNEQLRHVKVQVEHFVEREFITLLDECPTWDRTIHIQRVHPASNSIQVDLLDEVTQQVATLTFQEQSGWLVAGFIRPGWLHSLNEEQQRIMCVTLAGLYTIGRVDMVREKIHALIPNSRISYDVTHQGLVIWPDSSFNDEALYDLSSKPYLSPTPLSIARRYNLPVLDFKDLVFSECPISWDNWVDWWEADPPGSVDIPELDPDALQLLPYKAENNA